MRQVKKCIKVVSNLNGSAAMDYKVIKFKYTPINPDILQTCSFTTLHFLQSIWHLRAI